MLNTEVQSNGLKMSSEEKSLQLLEHEHGDRVKNIRILNAL